MKIAVCVKHSYDVEQLKYDPKTREPLLSEAPKKMGEVDRRALEEALRLKEKLGASVSVFTAGDQSGEDSIRLAYAMGADEGHLVLFRRPDTVDSTVIAEALARAIKRAGPFDLILTGFESTDSSSRLVPAKLSAALNMSFLPNVKSLSIEGNRLLADCETEDAVYKCRTEMPAVVAVSLSINEPRTPTLSMILKASKRPINKLSASDLGLEEKTLDILKVELPEIRRKRIILEASDERKISETVEKLIEALRSEGAL